MNLAIEGPCGVLNSGDAATWFGSAGTLLAFVVALFLLRVSAQDRKRAQARLVSGSIRVGRVKRPVGYTFPSDLPHEFRDSRLRAPTMPEGPSTLAADAIAIAWVLANDSDEMLGRVRLVLVDQDGVEVVELTAKPFMRPKEVQELTSVWPQNEAPAAPLRPLVLFEDAVGRTWQRAPGSPLRYLSKREAKLRLSVQPADEGTWVQDDPQVPSLLRFEKP